MSQSAQSFTIAIPDRTAVLQYCYEKQGIFLPVLQYCYEKQGIFLPSFHQIVLHNKSRLLTAFSLALGCLMFLYPVANFVKLYIDA